MGDQAYDNDEKDMRLSRFQTIFVCMIFGGHANSAISRLR